MLKLYAEKYVYVKEVDYDASIVADIYNKVAIFEVLSAKLKIDLLALGKVMSGETLPS